MQAAQQDQARRIHEAVRALVRRFSVSERADVACCGMTVAQAATLDALACCGSVRLSELSRKLGIAPSTLTRNWKRLEEKGLVEKLSDPEDRRAWLARLTPAGQSAAKELEEQELDFARQVVCRLPEKSREPIAHGLELLLQAIRAETESCCGGAFEHLVQLGKAGLAARPRLS